MTQNYGPTNVTVEPPGHGYAHWHNGIDWSMSIGTNIAASRDGVIGNKKEDLYDGQTDSNNMGNYVFVAHDVPANRWSLYYHLTHNGVLYSTGAYVGAGTHIAESGNTGLSSGPHLHYSLMLTSTCQVNTCDTDPRLWTTSPGRVPFQAQYYSENNSGTVYIGQYRTVTHWVKFKNTGGRPWNNTNDINGLGRVALWATNSAGNATVTSVFRGPDWEGPSEVTGVTENAVAVDGIGTFSFSLTADTAVGSYPNNYFNLRAEGMAWFDHDELGDYYIPIQVLAP